MIVPQITASIEFVEQLRFTHGFNVSVRLENGR